MKCVLCKVNDDAGYPGAPGCRDCLALLGVRECAVCFAFTDQGAADDDGEWCCDECRRSGSDGSNGAYDTL